MQSSRLLFIAVFLLSSMHIFAQWRPTGNLTVFSEDGAKFYLVLNGERYNDVAQTNIRIEELPNPYYNCRIIFEDKSLPAIEKNHLMLADADNKMQDVTYRIKRDNKGRNVLRFYSFVPAVQNMARPANCATYRYGAANQMIAGPGFVPGGNTSTTIATTTIQPASMNLSVGNIGMSIPVGTVTTTTTTTSGSRIDYGSNRTNYRGHDDYNERNNYNSRGGCNTPMRANDFEDARRAIADNSFDDTKLTTAKQILSSNCMSANQIAAVMKEFTFEESKLEFAKFAHPYCVDKNNYYKLNSAFTFESSKTDLSKFVQNAR